PARERPAREHSGVLRRVRHRARGRDVSGRGRTSDDLVDTSIPAGRGGEGQPESGVRSLRPDPPFGPVPPASPPPLAPGRLPPSPRVARLRQPLAPACARAPAFELPLAPPLRRP